MNSVSTVLLHSILSHSCQRMLPLSVYMPEYSTQLDELWLKKTMPIIFSDLRNRTQIQLLGETLTRNVAVICLLE